MAIFSKILKSRVGLAVVAFIAGGAVVMFVLPEKITIKKDTEIVEVEKVVEKVVEVEVEKVVEKVVEKTEKVRVVKRKETFPDGHIIEEEIYESESEQVDRIREETEQKYKEVLAQKESEFNEKLSYFKELQNPKRFNLYAGLGFDAIDFKDQYVVGGFHYTLWGPFTIGAQGTTRPGIAATIGITF